MLSFSVIFLIVLTLCLNNFHSCGLFFTSLNLTLRARCLAGPGTSDHSAYMFCRCFLLMVLCTFCRRIQRHQGLKFERGQSPHIQSGHQKITGSGRINLYLLSQTEINLREKTVTSDKSMSLT